MLDNAISFAVSGRIALSLEIGSAYAIQVALLQIPVVVIFSAIYGSFFDAQTLVNPAKNFKPFTLVFPQWDFYSVIFSVFLLTYVYLEGKSNYFKGAILLLCYSVIIVAYSFSPY